MPCMSLLLLLSFLFIFSLFFFPLRIFSHDVEALASLFSDWTNKELVTEWKHAKPVLGRE